jgi:3'-phosphoadenosine 5'-phosphosulfate sulfotransferase (PAPS reductase)/FAD synthetase
MSNVPFKNKLTSASLSAISLSYNGGKDCLVLLILYIAALASHPSFSQDASAAAPESIQSVYIVSQHAFPEVESFVHSTSQSYSLSLTRYAKGLKAAFQDYLQDFPAVKSIFVGTRRTDPHGGSLTHFDETDHGWPQFMRVHPVLDWHYVDIWTVSTESEVPLLIHIVHLRVAHPILPALRSRIHVPGRDYRHVPKSGAAEAVPGRAGRGNIYVQAGI